MATTGRVAAALAVLSLSSCNFAVKHPAVTAGFVGGGIALGSCELAASNQVQCLEIGGGAGLGLAVIAAVALWLGYEDDTTAAPRPTEVNAQDPTNLAPAPVFVPKALTIDAGVPVAPDAAVDASVDGP